jgi:putative phosphonate metabolism protein
MKDFRRYAIYYAPEDGGFADAAAAWLGWDLARGQVAAQPSHPANLPSLTAEPRKYGLHGTIKPPFRLAEGVSAADLAHATRILAANLPPLEMDGLDLTTIDGFLAFLPNGDTRALNAVAAEVVRVLDPFRAPLTLAEITRRRPEALNARQKELLAIYGYPFVMEYFQFHLTLSGRLDAMAQSALSGAAHAHFDGLVPQPFRLRDLCLCGEDEVGQFHLLHRYPLMA